MIFLLATKAKRNNAACFCSPLAETEVALFAFVPMFDLLFTFVPLLILYLSK